MTEEFLSWLAAVIAEKGTLFKGIKILSSEEYKALVESEQADPDMLYLVWDEGEVLSGVKIIVNGEAVDEFDADTKQDKEDEGLETVAKNIVDAINEVRRSIPSLAGLASERYAEQKAAEKAGEALQSAKAYMDKAIVEEVAKIVAGADASFDTLKEIADWIKSHPESVAAINALIQANTEKIILNETAVANVRVLLEELQSNSVKVSDGDAFVKNALTNLTLTNDEKTSMCNAIGAMPKPTTNPTGIAVLQVAFNAMSGGITYNYATVGLNFGNIAAYQDNKTDLSMLFGNGTTLYVDTPKGAKQTANKKYVDDLFATRRKVYKLSEFMTELGQGKFTEGALVVFTMLPMRYPALRVQYNGSGIYSVEYAYLDVDEGVLSSFRVYCQPHVQACKTEVTHYDINLGSRSPIVIADWVSSGYNTEVYVYD